MTSVPPDDEGQRRGITGWKLFHLVYLLFYFPEWFWRPPTGVDVAAAALAIAAFVPLYLHAFERQTARFLPHIAGMQLIAFAVTPFSGLESVFHVYACVQAAFQRPARRAIWLLATLTLTYVAFTALTGGSWLNASFGLVFGIITGIACMGQAESLEREAALRRARVLERQRAALEERERIAHDLHDLLGHTLTMVALKSDVASKMIDRDPARARDEIIEVGRAARTALKEIREAVYDMTVTTVEAELASARRALEAAGVTLQVRGAVPPLAPSASKALGLAIREAATNVVRHSRANEAIIEIDRDGERLRLTVTDNGVGVADGQAEGAGLTGVRRRIAALGGRTAIRRAGGMQLFVEVPVPDLAAGSR